MENILFAFFLPKKLFVVVGMFLVNMGFNSTYLETNKLAWYYFMGNSERRNSWVGDEDSLTQWYECQHIAVSSPCPESPRGAQQSPRGGWRTGGLVLQLTNTELGKSAAFIAGCKQACSLSRGDMLPYLSRFSAAPVTLRNGLGMARGLL